MTASAGRTADVVEIDALLPLSGNGAALGAKALASLTAIEQRVNSQGGLSGRSVHFVVHDDRSDPAVASAIASDIRARGTSVVLGSTLVGICAAIARVVEDSGPLQYCFASGFSPKANGFTFASMPPTRDLMRAALEHARRSADARLALITTDDPGGHEARDAFRSAADLPENRGVNVVGSEIVSDVTADAAREAVRRVLAARPTTIVIWSVGTPATTLLKAAAESGTTTEIVTAPGAVAAIEKAEPETVPARILAPHVGPLTSDPHVDPSVGDAAMLVLDALRHSAPSPSADDLRRFVAQQRTWIGTAGIYDFTRYPQRGIGYDSVVLTEWHANERSWTEAR